MPVEFQIRLAAPDDAEIIAQVLHGSFVEFRPLYTQGGFAATSLPADQVAARMSQGPVWIAFHEDAVLGSVAAVIEEESVYMRGMAVLPSARGLGVGGRLVETVEQWTLKQGLNRIFLSTTPFLYAAIRLYEKHGFQRMDTAPHELFGTPLFLMEKKLSRHQ
jgi:GNAT superfamily N-acetyltransferase